jgi:hypothetical protein
MSHFAEEDWADFVRQETTAEQKGWMERHLQEGCPECTRMAGLWNAVRRLAGREGSYQPPPDAVRWAKHRYPAQKPAGLLERVAQAASLVFDSAGQPLAVGVRAGKKSSRQLLYRAGDRLFKLRLDRPPDSGRMSLVGQIVDESNPQAAQADVAVLVLRGAQTITGTLTNRLGEFELEFEPARSLRLSVGTPGTRPVTLRLPLGDTEGFQVKGTRGA